MSPIHELSQTQVARQSAGSQMPDGAGHLVTRCQRNTESHCDLPRYHYQAPGWSRTADLADHVLCVHEGLGRIRVPIHPWGPLRSTGHASPHSEAVGSQKRYLAQCTRAYNGYVQAHHRMAKRVLKPITCRLTTAQALQIVESICASEGHENNIFF